MATLQALGKDGEVKMKRAVDNLKREFAELRGGRATPALLDTVIVEYYGTHTPLKQLAAITAPEPRTLVVQPWDANALPDVERAIQKADLGVSPIVDGKLVRLPIPPLSGERRIELTRIVHRIAEEGRVTIRTIRRDINDHLKKMKSRNEATEDDVFKGQAQIQKLTDQFIEQINQLAQAKEHELHG